MPMPVPRVDARTLIRALVVLAVLTTVIIAFQQRSRVANALQDPAGGHVSDFDRWMIMTPRFLHERVDYVNDELPTPPLTLIAFAPLTRLSRPDAVFVWVLVKLPLAWLVFALSAAIVARTGTRLTHEAIVLVIVAWALSVVADMQQGQTNFLALLPLVAGLYIAQEDALRSDLVAGGLVGLAVAVKLTPLVFVGYFAWRRRWWLVGSAVLSLAVWWLVVPALVFGWDQNLKWFGQWAQIMIVPYVVQGEVVYATTQSVGSFLLRLLSDAPAFLTGHDGVGQTHYMNVMALSEAAVHQIVRGTMVAVALAGLWWMRHPLPNLRSHRYVIEIAVVAAFMLWFSERTWVHHYISFVLVLCAAGMIVSDSAMPDGSRRRITRAVLGYFCVTLFATEAGQVLGRDGIEWATAFGVYLIPSVVVTAMVIREATRGVSDRDRVVL